jgi:hypothetical protein
MNNTTKAVSEVGQLARGLISDGLMVNAEIALEEPEYGPKGLDEALLKLVNRYGAEQVLASIHDAACGAAEVHEDCSEFDEEHYGVVAVRLKVFCRKIRSAMDALK